MARLLSHFPNRSSIEFHHETYSIDPKDKPRLPHPVRNWKEEVESGVPPPLQPHPKAQCHSNDALLGHPSIDSELPANLAMQDGSHGKKGEPLRSRSARGRKRTSSVPKAETAKVSSQIQQIFRFKSTPKLKLPSFELLGIANPRPEKFSLSRQSRASLGGQWPTDRERREAEIESVQLPELIVEGQPTPGHESVALLTPPDEHTILDWVPSMNDDSRDAAGTSMADSSMADFHVATKGSDTLAVTAASSGAGEGTTASGMRTEGQREGARDERSAAAQSSSRQKAEMSASESGQGWLEQAIAVAREFECTIIIISP